MNMTIRPATQEEQKYAARQSAQLSGQTGCIGILFADLDKDGPGFYSDWIDQRGYLKTEQFTEEFEKVINTLRLDKTTGWPLKNRDTLAFYCARFPLAEIKGDEKRSCFCVETENYIYLLRVDPRVGQDNLSCYCYRRDWLTQHIECAHRGIRFIDTNYNELFRINDGEKIRITYPTGLVKELECRYIDDYHLQVGHERMNLYHICEFAERMESTGCKVEPVIDGTRAQNQSKTKERGNER